MDPTHEIPTMAANASLVQSSECFTKFSCALATSLAVAKRMKWEQTPWLNADLEMSVCESIAYYISLQLRAELPWQALRYALLLGETYMSPEIDTDLATFPQLLVVFPHLKRDVSRDTRFIEFWHDQVVAPAFNQAWEDSGLVAVPGIIRDLFDRIRTPQDGRKHGKEALPAAGFLHHLQKGRMHRARVQWPEWKDADHLSDKRIEIFDEAWTSMKGMLQGLPGMEEFQDPFLIVVDRSRTDLNSMMSPKQMYQIVGEQWDQSIDARYVVPGSFKVMVETVIGDCNQIAEAIDEENEDRADELNGVQFKRMAGGADGEGESKTAKRRKTKH